MADLVINTKTKGTKVFSAPPINEVDLDKLREHVKNSGQIINQVTISQALAIYKIFKSGIWQTGWGYLTWKDYVKSEAGISPHRDDRIRRIAKVFDFLKVSDEDLEEIGYHKAFLLLALASKKYDCMRQENVSKWVAYAKIEGCSSRDLELAVEEAKKVKLENPAISTIDPPKELIKKSQALALETKVKTNKIEEEIAPSKEPSPVEQLKSDGESEIYIAKEGESIDALPSIGDGEEVTTASAPPGVAIVEQVEFKTKVYPDQLTVIQAALDKAKQSSGYDAPGMLLELISAEFLAQASVEFMAGPKYLQFICDCLSKVHGVNFSYDESAVNQSKVDENHPDDDEDDDGMGEVPF